MDVGWVTPDSFPALTTHGSGREGIRPDPPYWAELTERLGRAISNRISEEARTAGRIGVNITGLPNRWVVWFSVGGDLRFLSHHDLMRLMERAAARAAVPLKYTQGFNPHPKLSLPLPRPVGVASRCELAVLELAAQVVPVTVAPAAQSTQSGRGRDARDTHETPAWAERLAKSLPAGMSLLRVEPAPAGPPQVGSCDYEMRLSPPEQAILTERIQQLRSQEQWQVQREAGDAPARTIELKSRVRDVRVEGAALRFTLLVQDGSARPAEVLELLGLAADGAQPQTDTRTNKECAPWPLPERTAALPTVGQGLARLVRSSLQLRHGDATPSLDGRAEIG